MMLAELQLRLGELETVKKALADGKDLVDGPKNAADAAAGKTGETVVHSAYYNVAAEYYKLAGPPEKFYFSALRYLSYTPLESLSADTQRALAAELARLGEMLRVFHRGDVDAFSALVDAHGAAVGA